MFSDTATSISRSGVRQSPHTSFAYNSAQLATVREGVVVKTGPGENFECSVFVYCYQTKETLKVNASLAACASGGGIGSYDPYFVGDRVLVSYLYGDSNKPYISGRIYKAQGLSEELLSKTTDVSLPQPNAVTKSGIKIQPNPTTVLNGPTICGGFSSIKTRPMVI